MSSFSTRWSVLMAHDVGSADTTTGSPREIDPEICDELIALEHSARHFN